MHRYRVIDIIVRLGEAIPALSEGHLQSLSTDDLYRIVQALAHERHLLEEEDHICEQAIAIVVAELKRRGEKHLAIQRRMRRPDENLNASEVTRLLRKWEPILADQERFRQSAFVRLLESARREEERRASDPRAPMDVRCRARQRAETLRRWVELQGFRFGAAGIAALLGISAAGSYIVGVVEPVDLVRDPFRSPAIFEPSSQPSSPAALLPSAEPVGNYTRAQEEKSPEEKSPTPAPLAHHRRVRTSPAPAPRRRPSPKPLVVDRLNTQDRTSKQPGVTYTIPDWSPHGHGDASSSGALADSTLSP